MEVSARPRLGHQVRQQRSGSPTSVPAMSSRTLQNVTGGRDGQTAPAFNSEITIGTSAPPTGSTNSTPRQAIIRAVPQATPAADDQPATDNGHATRMVIHLPSGMTTGWVVISSCNFRY